MRSIPINKLGVVVHTCHLNYVGSINRRIVVQAGLGMKGRPSLKNNPKGKKSGGMAQLVEGLPKTTGQTSVPPSPHQKEKYIYVHTYTHIYMRERERKKI
jgi:hypothetical protein